MPIGVVWGLGVVIVAWALSWIALRKGYSVWGILLVGIFVIGCVYARLRGEFAEDGDSSPNVSEYVVRAEVSLAKSNLSTDHRNLLAAMLLGDRGGLSSEQKIMFRHAGAQHLLALSGMHLGILLTIVSILVLKRVRFTRWRWPVLAVVLLLLWWYVFMVGLPKSLLRAALMSTLYLAGSFSYRATRGHEVLSSTIFIMLLINPQCAFDIGAQLSVAALFGLTVFAPLMCELPISYDSAGEYVRPRWPKLLSLWRYFCYSFSAWLFTAPLILYHFGQIQPWQAVLGVFLVPVASFMLYGAVLVLVLALCEQDALLGPFSAFLDGFMDGFDGLLHLCGSLPYSYVSVGGITMWHAGLLYFLIAVLNVGLFYRTRRVLLLSLFVCVMALCVLALIL